jgi:hypothetical protein
MSGRAFFMTIATLAGIAGGAFVRSACSEDSVKDDALSVELKEMAKQVKAVVEKKGGGSIAVGAFTGTSRIGGHAGPDIQLKLANALTELHLPIDKEHYRFEVGGTYLDFEDPATHLLGAKLIGRLLDVTSGDTLKEIQRFVFGAESVPILLGRSPVTSPNADPQQLSDAFKKAMNDPAIDVQDGTRVKAAPDGQYAIEVLVKKDGKYVPQRATKNDKGFVFVPIQKKEVYAVRLINESSHKAAVNLTIDGISSFEFSTDKPKPKYWIVAPKSSSDIVGWDVDDDHSLEFKVTDFPETAAAKIKLKPSDTIGMIHAAFSAAWVKDTEKPSDESVSRGTGFGDKVNDNKKKVNVNIGHVREQIDVRYER